MGAEEVAIAGVVSLRDSGCVSKFDAVVFSFVSLIVLEDTTGAAMGVEFEFDVELDVEFDVEFDVKFDVKFDAANEEDVEEVDKDKD